MVKEVNNRGSMTVEAAFVLPLIILILFAVMTGSMYLYNKIKLQTDIRKTEQYAEAAIEKRRDRLGFLRYMTDLSEGVTADVLDYASELLSEGYFFLNGSVTELRTGYDEIEIDTRLRLSTVPIPAAEAYLEKFRTIGYRGRKKVCDYAEKARLYRVVMDTGKKIEFINENASSLGQMIKTDK